MKRSQRLVILGQGSWLLLKKCAHVGNTFMQFIPAKVLELSLLLLLTQMVNFRPLIEKVIVYEDKLTVEFKSGVTVDVEKDEL